MRRSRIRLRSVAVLLGGASCLALAGTHHIAASRAEAVRRAVEAVPGASVRSVEVDLLHGNLILGDITLAGPDLRVSIRHLEAPLRPSAGFGLVSEALAQTAAPPPGPDIGVDDIRIEVGTIAISIPHLSAEGTSLEGADLDKIFDAKEPGSFEDRLARLSAHTLTAAELKIEPGDAEIAAKNGALVFRNVVLSDVVAGKIKGLSADGASIVGASAPTTSGTLEIGKVAAANLDIPLAAKIIGGSRSDVSAPPTTLYDSFSIASIKFAAPAPDNAALEIGAFEGSGLKARPLLVPISDLAQRIDKARQDGTEDERRRTLDLIVDALQSLSLGHLALRDMAFAELGKEKPVAVKFATVALDANDVLRIASFVVENVSMTTPDADVSLARFAVEGVDQSGLPDALRQFGSLPGPDANLGQIKALSPKVSKIALSALHVQAPAKSQDGNSADGGLYIFDVPVVELKVGGYAGNMASDATSRIQFVYDVAPSVPNPGLRSLAQAGFGHLDITADTTVKWNAEKRALRIDQVSIAAKNLATLFFNAAMSNVSPDIFGIDEDARMAAVQQAKVDALEIGLTNLGMIDKALPILAQQAKMTIPAFKTDLKLKAHQMVLETLGDTPAARQIVRAVSAFIEKPKSFDLKVVAPKGLGMQDVATMTDPKDALGLLTITATANQ